MLYTTNINRLFQEEKEREITFSAYVNEMYGLLQGECHRKLEAILTCLSCRKSYVFRHYISGAYVAHHGFDLHFTVYDAVDCWDKYDSWWPSAVILGKSWQPAGDEAGF